MANGRSDPRRRKDSGRDPGGFVALPWAVLDSKAYQGLSHPAKALLMEVARQFHSDDNGRMLLSSKYLATRGWTGNDVITRAKRELLEAELIFETVKGQRPNKASWYAVTWRKLDRIDGYDPGAAAAFKQGAYQGVRKPIASSNAGVTRDQRARNVHAACGKPAPQNAGLTPPDGVESASIAPSHGIEHCLSTPPGGAIQPAFGGSPTPPDGDPLEKPSIGVRGESLLTQGKPAAASLDLLEGLTARMGQQHSAHTENT